MKYALVYIRVSTEEQSKDGRYSLSVQKQICTRTALAHGLKVLKVYEDPGRSATNMRRPGLQDLLLHCQDNPGIGAIVVQDTDRLARNTQDHLAIRAILRRQNVKLLSASQPMIEDSAEGNMFDTIIASVNQFQSELTSRKTRKGLQAKVEAGGRPGPAPLGYLNVGVGPENLQRIVIQDPKTAPMVKELFKRYSTGRYSLSELTRKARKKGLRNRSGKRACNISSVNSVETT